MIMHRKNPDTVHTPVGLYSHLASVSAGARLLFLSGQVGMDRHGKIASGAGEQARQALANIGHCLEAEGMTFADVARLNVFLVEEADMAAVREARQAVLGDGNYPASTLVVVKALAHPGLLVEIEVIAAR